MLCQFWVHSKVNQLNICIYPPCFRLFFPYRPLQSIEQSSLWCTIGPPQFLLHRVVCMSIPSSQFTPPCLFSSCNHQCVFYICDCFVNRFISILLLDSTYKHYHVVSVFLCLTSLSMTISRYIHVTAMTSFHSFNG